MLLYLPAALAQALWAHVGRECPREGVGAVGGVVRGERLYARALYPLPNVAAQPEREYLADGVSLLRSLRAMRAESLSLVALYHSHPHGPATPSDADGRQAAYDLPYLIADLESRTLRAFLLPSGEEVKVVASEEP